MSETSLTTKIQTAKLGLKAVRSVAAFLGEEHGQGLALVPQASGDALQELGALLRRGPAPLREGGARPGHCGRDLTGPLIGDLAYDLLGRWINDRQPLGAHRSPWEGVVSQSILKIIVDGQGRA